MKKCRYLQYLRKSGICYDFCTKNGNIENNHIYFNLCCESMGNYDKCPFFQTKIKPARYISKETRYIVLKRQNWRCNSCSKHLKYSNNHRFGDDVAHIDHIHPFSEWESYDGDINEISNLQALCGECNKVKYKHKD